MAIATQPTIITPKYTRPEKMTMHEVPENTRCGCCKGLVHNARNHRHYPIIHINVNRNPPVIYFCSKECKNKWVEVQRK